MKNFKHELFAKAYLGHPDPTVRFCAYKCYHLVYPRAARSTCASNGPKLARKLRPYMGEVFMKGMGHGR